MSDIPRRYTYPHVVENGSGERLVFVRRVAGAAGERVLGENFVSPGSGPPMHVHHLQAEALTVLEGRMGYQRLGEPAQFAAPGEEVVFAAGEAHRFWNAGKTQLRCSAWIEPPDNIEYFLTELFDSTRRNGGRRPHPLEAAFLLTRYRSEFGMPVIPAPVQRFIFPLLVLIGRITGRHRRYRDAPEPVRRRIDRSISSSE
jgi:quercetin dioxygenase-like cupin family protein